MCVQNNVAILQQVAPSSEAASLRKYISNQSASSWVLV